MEKWVHDVRTMQWYQFNLTFKLRFVEENCVTTEIPSNCNL